MISIKELQTKWDSISPFSGGFLLVSGEHLLSFHIGYANGESKCFMVLDTEKIENIPSAKAISAECVRTEKGIYALRFILNYESLDELFVKLCWDLIESSSSSDNPADKLISRYKSWMRLLQRAGDDILSSSVQKGLIGELLYLEESIQKIGEDAALNAWVGPEGSDQDYIFIDSWTEVKTTSIASESVTISSLQQLDRSDKGFLVIYLMDKTSSNGIGTVSLPEAVKRIVDMLSCDMQDQFSCKLAKCGYFAKDSEKYADFRFRLSESRRYEVSDDFPKLTRNNIPTGITNARYDLNLMSLESYKV